jgi:hypothetical protein
LTAFLSILVLGAVLLATKCALEKRFDRWFAAGLAVLAVTCVASSLLARTQARDHFATVLLRWLPGIPAAWKRTLVYAFQTGGMDGTRTLFTLRAISL